MALLQSMHFPLSVRTDDRDMTHPELLRPPSLVLLVPLGRAFQAGLECDSRLPFQQLLCFSPVTSMAKHLTRPVTDVHVRLPITAHYLDHGCSDLVDAHVPAGTEIDHLARHPADVGIDDV